MLTGTHQRAEQSFGAYFEGKTRSDAFGAAYEGIYRLPADATGIRPRGLYRFFACLDNAIYRCPAGCGKQFLLDSLMHPPERQPPVTRGAPRRTRGPGAGELVGTCRSARDPASALASRRRTQTRAPRARLALPRARPYMPWRATACRGGQNPPGFPETPFNPAPTANREDAPLTSGVIILLSSMNDRNALTIRNRMPAVFLCILVCSAEGIRIQEVGSGDAPAAPGPARWPPES